MIDFFSNAILKNIQVNRIIGVVKGEKPGPTIVFFGGIHGNENSGVLALKEVLQGLKPETLKGTVFGISGNLKALKNQQRFIKQDLNRLWTPKQISQIKNKKNLDHEEDELLKILHILEYIISFSSPPFYFLDLHSTSSKTLPFITINDALINRKFSKQFPTPIVLGIEEYLNGPLLSYINQMGFVSLGFESGQHDSIRAISNSVAFIHLVLMFAGATKKTTYVMDTYFNELKSQSANLNTFFEVIYALKINGKDAFKMDNGFKSFTRIKRGRPIAKNNGDIIKSPCSGRIFMPLYQTQGEEGFFIIREIPPFFLNLSKFLRHFKFDQMLVLLPGVSWLDKKKGILQVNLKITRFFAKSLFHLLGYRHKQMTSSHLNLYNRERVAKTTMYKNEPWF